VILPSVVAALAALSFALGVWQWIAGRRFPIWKAEGNTGFFPAISILKPLKGADAETEKCLESWFSPEYRGKVQLLFGVASPDDPACEVVRRLIARHPHQKAELVIATPVLGPNAKVSTLCYLAKNATHEHLVVSDADVFVPASFFPEMLSSLREESVGIVNCFYALAQPRTLPMRFEAVAGNADFWTHVLQAVTLKPMDFALGAVMALRKRDLQKIGGFETLLEFLADDYELGNLIAQSGKELRICTIPVECRSDAYGWRAVWEHQVRWGRTIRVCRPIAYFFSIAGNGTLWPLLALLTASGPAKLLFSSMLMLRMLAAVLNYARLTRQWRWWVALIAPLQDIGQALIWIVSFLGNEIVWRGEKFRVDRRGKLTRLA
jgi:ceramide glucosyltransferase